MTMASAIAGAAVLRAWSVQAAFWQTNWERLLDVTGDDPFRLWVYGTLLVTFLVYWLCGGVYMFIDLTGWPKCLSRYKVQPDSNPPAQVRRRIGPVILQVLFNQIAVGLPFTIGAFWLMSWRGLAPIRELPKWYVAGADFVLCLCVEEAGFYYSHRLLHWPPMYQLIHRMHHEWTAPVAITAVYCHPLEHVLSNVLPPFLGIWLCGSHITTAWLWFGLAILNTLNAHSGYHLPFFPSPEAHDFHHLKYGNCFGVLGILDRLHGTDAMFRRSMASKRHIVLRRLASAREQFPDAEAMTSRQR